MMRILTLCFGFLLLHACHFLDEEKYVLEVKEYRDFKDKQFKNTASSPLPDEKKDAFKGLNYYAVDLTYQFKAEFVPLKQKDYIQLETSKNKVKEVYQKVGKLTFTLNKESYALDAFMGQKDKMGRLFVPFKDLSNGEETYDGGRYLYAIKQEGESEYVLDFNYAHNPFCAYGPNYDCPLPPKSNHLSIKILAGEKKLDK